MVLIFVAGTMQAYPGQHASSFVQNTAGFYPSSFYTGAAQSSMANYPGVRGKDATSCFGYPAPPYGYAGNCMLSPRCSLLYLWVWKRWSFCYCDDLCGFCRYSCIGNDNIAALSSIILLTKELSHGCQSQSA